MSLIPFSHREIDSIKDFFESHGWKIDGTIENYFRFSIKNDNLLILSLKFPVALPFRLNIPFEVASFYVSIAFKLWHLNDNSSNVLSILLKKLRDFALNVSMEHNFPLNGKENLLVEILNETVPERVKNENERSWINRIRVSILNKSNYFEELSTEEISEIVENLKEVGLNPTFNVPWELKKGIPKIRTSETLFFSNEETLDEFFILEKGFYSYFKDLVYKKIYIRTSFESYTPYILRKLYQDWKALNLGGLIQNWIKFVRMLLNSTLQILNTDIIDKNLFMQFNVEKEMNDDSFIEQINNFPFSPLQYEAQISKDLYFVHNDLLNRPPVNFKVLETINHYTEAEELYKSYKFDEATKKLNEALKIFNLYKNKKMVVSVLLFLKKIALLHNQDELAINYLESALNIAKSGEIPLEYIIKIQFQLAKVHYNRKNFYKAREHFRIIKKFFEDNQDDSIAMEYLGTSCIYLGIISAEENQTDEAMEYFKKVYLIAEKEIKVKLNFYLIRIIHYKRTGELKKVQKILKDALKTINFENIDNHDELLADLLLELAEFLIHNKKDNKNALYVLRLAKDRLTSKTVKGIQKSIRWNLLMSDYQRFLEKNTKESLFYVKQSKILKVQLQKIGL
ncbi:MAG: hypothetical protein P8Y97_13995 [Candidatus Lokiarchaeota archaeon]